MCGLRIESEGTRVMSIDGDRADPFSRGFLCPKGPALAALHEDPDRLRHPVKRVGDAFVRIGWAEAIDLAAQGLHRVQQAHGHNAVAVYMGNPTVHSAGAMLFMPMLIRALRTKNRFSATSVDQLPHHLAAYWMFGHQFMLPVPDIDRTDLFFIMGANPLASNGSLMTAPGMRTRLAELRARGGRVVVFDPRRTESARAADEHVFVRPGQDAWLLGAMVRHALAEGPALGRLAGYAEGVEQLARAVERFTFDRAAARTGVPAATLERLAREFCERRRAVVYGRIGLSTQSFGAVCQWLVNALNAVTGHLDEAGGAMFPSPAIDIADRRFGLSPGGHGRFRSRVRGLPESGGELPVATLVDEVETPGQGQVRALVTHAGNPVLSTPEGHRLDRALAGLEHMVAIDIYINETTRHASVILPPPSPLARPHYDLAFHQLAVRNTAKYADPLFERDGDTRQEWRIALDLIRALHRARGTFGVGPRAQHALLGRLGPVGLLDLGLRLGPHGLRAWPPRRGLSIAALRKAPHGVDLGPLVPRLPEALLRFRPRIDLAPPPLVQDLERLERESSAEELVLIGRRHLRSNNSWMHNVPKLMAGKPLCTLLMHPDDAEARGLCGGDKARVRSATGEVEVEVEVSDSVMRGVVSLPHGFGHHRQGIQLRVAEAHAGVSINDLTDRTRIDVLSGTAALSGVPVEVGPATPARRAAPDLAAEEPSPA